MRAKLAKATSAKATVARVSIGTPSPPHRGDGAIVSYFGTAIDEGRRFRPYDAVGASRLSSRDVIDMLGRCALRLVLPAELPQGAAADWILFAVKLPDDPALPRLIVAEINSALAQTTLGQDCVACAVHRQVLARWVDAREHEGGADPLPGIFGLPPQMETTARQLAVAKRSLGGMIHQQGLLQQLLCEIIAGWRNAKLPPIQTRVEGAGLDRSRLFSAYRLIEARFAEKLTIDEIGRHCGMSRAKLTRGFRLLFRKTIAEFLNDRRMLAAEAALRSTDLPVSHVAFQSGYHSNAAFSRAFTRRYGMAPSDYRHRAQDR